MTGKDSSHHVLVPEVVLLAPLPGHLKKRFSNALVMMNEQLEKNWTWEQIARHCAISPAHFHRQFKSLFNETPGHYLSRLRLQKATDHLLNNQRLSVTEIAQYCGFSSSQAMGKALKRQLGVTARAIQNMAINGTPRETGELLMKLAQPSECPDGSAVEELLAETIPAELIWLPKRTARTVRVKSADWDDLYDQFGDDIGNLMVLTPIAQLNHSWQLIEATVCDWSGDVSQHDLVLPEGHYLCCEVLIATPAAYLAALEGLFQIADQRGLDVVADGLLVEQILGGSEKEGGIFAFQIPVLE
ncbi:helix-turn-helix transcriptional regulator [Gynuella sunshinyii]|uniref:Transcriptional regulator containing an amidase domain and an AraC-type DNA-binding HTH domain n=1 Tax=Gynuella sunshinyii YC6258 TaxID=1445510 RepID=A0A0C5W0I7_9GAMM|nr:helix-turn-helix transcriptional regulator [Gynuella sunshinyii]AJQ96199.1 transcriptional regulator containing an amidase domain and an AraC-type DNA-binding HTH domain [Gynuella sunshinyii YC6258]